MQKNKETLIHFPILSKADFIFFRLLGNGLGNLLFPVYRAFQAHQQQGGQLVFPQFAQIKIGPLLRGELDTRAYSDIFKKRTAAEIFLHIKALGLCILSKNGNSVLRQEGLGNHFKDLDYKFKEKFKNYIIKKYKNEISLLETLKEISVDDICVHVRRGDFQPIDDSKSSTGEMNYQIADDWYIKATSLARKKSPNGKVRVFTDAPSLPENLLNALHADEIDDSPDALHALLKMSAHGHLIASKSSFSLWAAFLGNTQTIVSHDFDIEKYMNIETISVFKC